MKNRLSPGDRTEYKIIFLNNIYIYIILDTNLVSDIIK